MDYVYGSRAMAPVPKFEDASDAEVKEYLKGVIGKKNMLSFDSINDQFNQWAMAGWLKFMDFINPVGKFFLGENDTIKYYDNMKYCLEKMGTLSTEDPGLYDATLELTTYALKNKGELPENMATESEKKMINELGNNYSEQLLEANENIETTGHTDKLVDIIFEIMQSNPQIFEEIFYRLNGKDKDGNYIGNNLEDKGDSNSILLQTPDSENTTDLQHSLEFGQDDNLKALTSEERAKVEKMLNNRENNEENNNINYFLDKDENKLMKIEELVLNDDELSQINIDPNKEQQQEQQKEEIEK